MDKSTIRTRMKDVLGNCKEEWLIRASVSVCRNLAKFVSVIPEEQSLCLLAWLPFFKGEPDIACFLEEALRQRKVFLPVLSADMIMWFRDVGPVWPPVMVPGVKGIPERPEGAELYNLAFAGATLVLLPGIAFDRAGGRLGRGGGCYDRFLVQAELRGALKVGVCWSFQILDEVPVAEHDVRVDWICTEQGLIETNQPSSTGR